MPRGFNKQTATVEIVVFGGAVADPDFNGEGNRVRYRAVAAGAASVQADLRYQPIGYRWAQNLSPYKAPEPQNFVRYYNAVGSGSSVVVARALAFQICFSDSAQTSRPSWSAVSAQSSLTL